MNSILCRMFAHWRRRNHAAKVAHQGAAMSKLMRDEMREVMK